MIVFVGVRQLRPFHRIFHTNDYMEIHIFKYLYSGQNGKDVFHWPSRISGLDLLNYYLIYAVCIYMYVYIMLLYTAKNMFYYLSYFHKIVYSIYMHTLFIAQ